MDTYCIHFLTRSSNIKTQKLILCVDTFDIWELYWAYLPRLCHKCLRNWLKSCFNNSNQWVLVYYLKTIIFSRFGALIFICYFTIVWQIRRLYFIILNKIVYEIYHLKVTFNLLSCQFFYLCNLNFTCIIKKSQNKMGPTILEKSLLTKIWRYLKSPRLENYSFWRLCSLYMPVWFKQFYQMVIKI